MKKVLLGLGVIIALGGSAYMATDWTEAPDGQVSVTARRCTGSANCRACTNCRYCKHCSRPGNSCGVCR